MNLALTALLVFCLIAWGFVLVPPAVRLLSGVVRPSDSIGSFRAKMTVLGGTPPMNPTGDIVRRERGVLDLTERRSSRVSAESAAQRRAAKARRRQIFTGLLGATPVTFLAAVVVGGPAWVLFALTLFSFAGYTALLWQMQQAALERSRKVAFLPASEASSATRADLRPVSIVAR
ncbi:MAG: hypothetical protein ACXIVQ_11915 [Acidimicrobiales bacterium]